MEELRLQEELRKTRQELLLLYEIGNLIRVTLLLDEVIYLILSAMTSHEGMSFNRAILFMLDDSGTQLEGKMGIGPTHPEVSPKIWRMIEENKITLEGLLDVYHKAGGQIDPELNSIVRQIRLPIEKDFGILAKAAINDSPYLVSKEEASHELGDMRLKNLGFEQFAVVPLRGKNHVIGVLIFDNISTKKEIKDADVRRVMMLADHAGLALENAKTFSAVVTSAQQDSLTHLWNHGHFQKLLHESLREAKAGKTKLSLLIFDVDDFKTFNDRFGHQAGDRALQEVARITKTVMRRNDYVARYGGEEFAAVLPSTSKEEALKLAERLRETIQKETSNQSLLPLPEPLTISVGVAAFPDDAEEKEKLIFCADGALYEAKYSGKNKVCIYKKPGK